MLHGKEDMYIHTVMLQEAFTLVLKGHIDLCSLVFPNKTHGKCM